jgi:TonB family protein
MILWRRVSFFMLAATVVAGCAHGPESAPVSTTETAPDDASKSWLAYLHTVKEKIRAHWSNPCLPDIPTGECAYQTAEVTLLAEVHDDGTLRSVRVVKSSGMTIYDDYAVNAVTGAAPFDAIPEALRNAAHPALRIEMRFNYNPPRAAPRTQ